MLDALHIYLALLFALVAFLVELQYRAKLGMQPGSVREFIRWGQKKNTPNKRYSALIFALSAVFCFQLWESFIRFLFGVLPSWAWILGPSLGLLFLVVYRLVQFRAKSRENVGLKWWWVTSFVLFTCLLLNSWGMLIGVPWVAYRSKFLGDKK